MILLCLHYYSILFLEIMSDYIVATGMCAMAILDCYMIPSRIDRALA